MLPEITFSLSFGVYLTAVFTVLSSSFSKNLADSCGEQVIHINLSSYFQKFCVRNLLWPDKWHDVSKICCVEG